MGQPSSTFTAEEASEGSAPLPFRPLCTAVLSVTPAEAPCGCRDPQVGLQVGGRRWAQLLGQHRRAAQIHGGSQGRGRRSERRQEEAAPGGQAWLPGHLAGTPLGPGRGGGPDQTAGVVQTPSRVWSGRACPGGVRHAAVTSCPRFW